MIPPFRRSGKTNTSRNIKGWRTTPLPLRRSAPGFFTRRMRRWGGKKKKRVHKNLDARGGNEKRARNQRPGTTEGRGQTRSETWSAGWGGLCTVNLSDERRAGGEESVTEERLKKKKEASTACLAPCLSLWPLWRLAPN